MARGKHSTALFEVIHSARKPERIAQSLRTPKWWFKGRPESSAGSEPVSRFEDTPVAEPSIPSAPPPPPVRASSPPRSPRSSAIYFDFDRDRKELTLRLRYTTAVVSGFALFVALGMAYIVGRHLGRGPATAVAAEQPGIEELRQEAPRPAVIAVQKPQVSSHPNTQRLERPAPIFDPPPEARPARTTSVVPAGAETRLPRVQKLNYVVIQIYPPEERATAESTREFFNRAGIPCTLEKTGWAPSYISLVGTAGFARTSSPEFKSYLAAIQHAAENLKTSRFDRPQPTPYAWKGPPTDQSL